MVQVCTVICRLSKDGKNIFQGIKYMQAFSETTLYYIGILSLNAKTLNAFTNPSTNSYKRLVPGYEAPVLPFTCSPKQSFSLIFVFLL